jgi:hypothetical protein
VDRQARRLALDVPQGDIDAADGAKNRSPAPDLQTCAEHPVPQPPGVKGVLADEQRAQKLGDGGGYQDPLEAVRDALDALLRFDADQGVVAVGQLAGGEGWLPCERDAQHAGAHRSYLHAACLG